MTKRSHRDVARDVLNTEAAGLLSMASQLGPEFDAAVELLASVTGRLVVAGMGKSGLVGRKIAATLASTGSPALFVHPAEASHGDLGMIVPGDVVIALSNSGETAELTDLIGHCRRFRIPMVSITGNAESTLAQKSDIALTLPKADEACPHGLTPTTSTTMQLALGDAIAVALLVRRNFTATDFRVFHPGGKLGSKLRLVRDLMHAGDQIPLAPPSLPMSAALVTITEKRFGCLGVTDAEGRLAGIVTDGDIRRAMGPDFLSARVGDVMTGCPLTISPDALAVEALAVMNDSRRPVTVLFVVDAQGKPTGILHIHDLLRVGVA